MRCPTCNGNIIVDSWDRERCLQCGREPVQEPIYAERSAPREPVKELEKIFSKKINCG